MLLLPIGLPFRGGCVQKRGVFSCLGANLSCVCVCVCVMLCTVPFWVMVQYGLNERVDISQFGTGNIRKLR